MTESLSPAIAVPNLSGNLRVWTEHGRVDRQATTAPSSSLIGCLRPHVVVTTGMHRSGTSLISSILQKSGVHIGEHLIAPNVANPRGFFEDVDFYEFHERLLHERGQSYLYLTPDFDFFPTESETARAAALIAERADHAVWGWKDPRTCLFLSMWHQLLPEARFVFSYRHPWEVLLSLLRRGEFDEYPILTAGLHAWQIYNTNIKNFCDQFANQSALVHIDGLLSHADQFVHLLRDKLELDIPISAEIIDELYHADELIRSPFPREAANILDRLQPNVLELYHQLNERADIPAPELSSSADATPALCALESFTISLATPISQPHEQYVLQLLSSLLAPNWTSRSFGRFSERVRTGQKRVDELWEEVQRLERTNAAQERSLDELNSRCDQLTSSLQQERMHVEVRRAQSEEQHIRNEKLQRKLADQVTQIQQLQAELEIVRRTLTWKLIARFSGIARRWFGRRAMETPTTPSAPATEIDTSVPERIAELRQLQAELRMQPVTGSVRRLKKLFYKLVHSTFARQFRLNAGTVDLIETVYRELEGQRWLLRQQTIQMQLTVPRVDATSPAQELPSATGDVLASCGEVQNQAELNNIRPLDGFDVVYSAPAELRMPERVVLYSLVFGLQPRNCLEIGTFRGGSTAIICGAMDDTGHGQLACVDPAPKIDPELWSRISHRCRIFEGGSPDILPDVSREMGVAFDFAFIDGNHTYDYVRRDIAGVLPLLADSAYVLFHDAHHGDVRRAVDEAVAGCPELADCGLLSVEPTILMEGNRTVTWAGLRLLHYRRNGSA